MNVINVVKPLKNAVISKVIKEHILERNPMNVINVVKPFPVTVVFATSTHLQCHKRTHTGE